MASPQAASSGTAVAAIGETIAGSHMRKIQRFSGTKDLGVGKSFKSSTFTVGGHSWHIECYPCGVDEKNTGWVALFLCLSLHEEQVVARCSFYSMLLDENGDPEDRLLAYYDEHTYNAENSWRKGGSAIGREKLESILMDDCFQIACVVCIVKEFPAVPPPGPHRPLSDHASGMPGHATMFRVAGELFTLHRGLKDPSAQMAASPTSAAGSGTAATVSIENVAGSHVVTIEGYSNMKKLFGCHRGSFLESNRFEVGGQDWQMDLYPCGHEENDADCLDVFVYGCYAREAVKARLELTLLTLAREVISSTKFCYIFRGSVRPCRCRFPLNMDPEFSCLLGDSFHVKCDITVVKKITPMRPTELHFHLGNLLANQLGTDVTFDVGGELFSAHKCVLATRSTAFLAEFFGPGKEKCADITPVRIDNMEPRVFKTLLHFIYTDALPEVHEDDRIAIAQGLLVAADRYAMERLKLMCGDMLCVYINDARTAITTLDLADKHGCPKLREACKKFLLEYHCAEVAP